MRIIQHIQYLVVLLLITAFSCSSGSTYELSKEYGAAPNILTTEERSEKTLDYEFEKENISDLGLQAFEKRASEKIKDFVDYLELISDHSIDSIFKFQAETMLLSLFENKNTALIIKNKTSKKQRKNTITGFLEMLNDEKYSKPDLQVKNIRITRHLSPQKPGLYSGLIEFSLTVSPPKKGKSVIPGGNYISTGNIMVKKINKTFGNTSKQTWEVLLGDITFTRQ